MTELSGSNREENPYQAPAFLGQRVELPVDDDAIAIRRSYLDREGAVKTIALIYWLACGVSLVTTLVTISSEKTLAAAIRLAGQNPAPAVLNTFRWMMIGSMAFGILLNTAFGVGLRLLINWVRIVVMILTILGFVFSLFGFLGQLTLRVVAPESAVSLLSLGLFLAFTIFMGNPETKFVFSPEYKSVIARTPDIKPEFGTRDKVYLVLYGLLAFLGLGLQVSKLFKT